jgi:hypothetical protein
MHMPLMPEAVLGYKNAYASGRSLHPESKPAVAAPLVSSGATTITCSLWLLKLQL